MKRRKNAPPGFPGRAWILTPLERNEQNPYQLLSQHGVDCQQACYVFIHVFIAAWLFAAPGGAGIVADGNLPVKGKIAG